jgi:alkylation response protein AidB-like acyl-CoA dehydrogenase
MDRFAFPLEEEEVLVARAAREYAREVGVDAAERDRTGRFPTAHVAKLSELGLLAMKVPAEHGGAGATNVGYALVMEAIAEACASTAVVLASSNLASKILADHGNEAQRARWLVPYARGALGPASFALTEPSAGSDAAAIRTTARLAGNHWILDGQKAWITSAAHAGLHVVFARTENAEGREALSCFVLERGTPGLAVGREEDKMGQRSSGTAQLLFDQCAVPAENMIGQRGEGYRIALSAVGAGRVGIGALAIGIAEAALAQGIAYVKERKAFGQTLADFQNTQFVLADSRTDLDAAWLLVLRAARLLDRGERVPRETSMAKLFATEACGRVVDRMVQLHGGYGYSRDYPVERHYRDARVTRIYEGTSEIQRLVIARDMLRA